MQLFDRSGKVALVTGSSHNIGQAIASRLILHGANSRGGGRHAVHAQYRGRAGDIAGVGKTGQRPVIDGDITVA